MEGLGWRGLGRWGGFLKEEVLELGLEEEGEVGGRWAQKVPGLRPGGEGAWNSRGWLVCSVLSHGTALAHGLPCPRLAEKKASIGYTYEDSTVAEVEKVAEKPEEEESPAEEESNSDEDEVIPDIGGVPSLPSPPIPQSLGIVLCLVPHPLWGAPCSRAPSLPPLLQGTPAFALLRLTHVLFPAPLCPFISRTLLYDTGSVLLRLGWPPSLPPLLFLCPLENKYSSSYRAIPHPPAGPLPQYPAIQPSTISPSSSHPSPQPAGDFHAHMESVHPTSTSASRI